MPSSTATALGGDTDQRAARLPIASLLALSLAGFVTILTEALPAGLLPQISAGLGIPDALAGQLVTLYAIGSLVAAIPLVAATQGVRRRPLLLAALAGFVVANTVTTFSSSYVLTVVARFLAGVSAGLLWALLAGYAARMVPEQQKGRAIAIAMVGTPLALSLGVPAGTLLGNLVGWRMCFGIMSLLALLLMVWVRVKVPDFAGQAAGKRLSLGQVFTMPGVRPVLFVVLAFVLAHNILYTYISAVLGDGWPGRADGPGAAGVRRHVSAGNLDHRCSDRSPSACADARQHGPVWPVRSDARRGRRSACRGLCGGRSLGVGLRRCGHAVPDRHCQDGREGGRCCAVHAGHGLEYGDCRWWHHWRHVVASSWRGGIPTGNAGAAGGNAGRRVGGQIWRVSGSAGVTRKGLWQNDPVVPPRSYCPATMALTQVGRDCDPIHASRAARYQTVTVHAYLAT